VPEAPVKGAQIVQPQPELKKPEGEAKEGTTHEAHPVKKNDQPAGGFPENLDPVLNQVVPAPQPSLQSPAPAPAPVVSPAK
jgi:hypothetical protein